MEMQETILLGVVSSVIASIVFYLLMILIKPRFIISDKMCLIKSNEEYTEYAIKVVNLTHSFIINVNYSLLYCTEGKDGIKEIKNIKPAKYPIMNVNKYTHKNTDYAIRVTYRINHDKYPLDDSSFFVFTFQACHSFSNAMQIKEQVYSKKDILQGIFETGKSTKILTNR